MKTKSLVLLTLLLTSGCITSPTTRAEEDQQACFSTANVQAHTQRGWGRVVSPVEVEDRYENCMKQKGYK